MSPLINPRNYFFPVAENVQLAEDLSGELVYMENPYGSPSSDAPIAGLFPSASRIANLSTLPMTAT